MNKYIIPICDIQSGNVFNWTISSRNISDCQEKLMKALINEFDFLDYEGNYNDFVEQADKKDLLIGDITDIETL